MKVTCHLHLLLDHVTWWSKCSRTNNQPEGSGVAWYSSMRVFLLRVTRHQTSGLSTPQSKNARIYLITLYLSLLSSPRLMQNRWTAMTILQSWSKKEQIRSEQATQFNFHPLSISNHAAWHWHNSEKLSRLAKPSASRHSIKWQAKAKERQTTLWQSDYLELVT